MAKKIMERDFIYKALSVLFAIVFWLFVTYTENPEKELWFGDIPITFINENSLSEQQLCRIKKEAETVAVKVKGSRKALVSLSSADIVATVDLSTIKFAKTYTLPVTIKFPVDGLTVIDKKPLNVKVAVEDIIKKDFPLEIKTQGAMASSAEIAACSADIATVTVSGGRSIVDEIKGVVVRPNVTALAEDKKITSEIEVVAKDGTILKNAPVELSKVFAEVDIKVNITRKIPINVVFGSGISDMIEECHVTPSIIEIAGRYSDVKDITVVNTNPIVVYGEGEETVTVLLQMPEKVENVNNTTEVTVKIKFKKGNTDE